VRIGGKSAMAVGGDRRHWEKEKDKKEKENGNKNNKRK